MHLAHLRCTQHRTKPLFQEVLPSPDVRLEVDVSYVWQVHRVSDTNPSRSLTISASPSSGCHGPFAIVEMLCTLAHAFTFGITIAGDSCLSEFLIPAASLPPLKTT